MSKRKNKITNWPRFAMQWAVILVIIFLAFKAFIKDSFVADFEAYCPFGGIQAIGSYLLNNSLACTMTSTQMVMGALLIILVILFSKLFCSYICPIGTISEWLGKLGDKLKIRITIKGVLDKILRSLKYILLFITLYFTFKSNELFCKEFDPFYAIMSGYDSDVTVLYATIAIAITILGSIFVRLFWCKYLCPLGAISNIFKFTGLFVGIMVVYIVLLLLGVNIHYAWPLGIAAVGGYIFELIGPKNRLFPVAKITRNEETCTNCQLCSLKCPQAIDVAKMTVVKDVDCNLCSECVTACPEKGTIQINKRSKLKWLAPIAIASMFALGLVLQSFWEVPTISQKWGDEAQLENASKFSREGLKNIKCYGSSSAFASKMRKVKGVYGVSTYVGTHKVEILYDSTIISTEKLEESLFTANKAVLRVLGKENKNVTEITVMMENFFDTYDFSYMSRLLQQKTKAVAMMTEYGCPIKLKIFFPETEEIDQEALKEILESKELEYKVGEKTNAVELNFEVVGKMQTADMSKGEYITLLFNPYASTFNDYKTYDSTVVDIFTLPMGKNARMAKRLNYLVSHISKNNGIIKLETKLNNNYKQIVEFSYVDTMTTEADVFEIINSDSLSITYTSGKTQMVENMFHFEMPENKQE